MPVIGAEVSVGMHRITQSVVAEQAAVDFVADHDGAPQVGPGLVVGLRNGQRCGHHVRGGMAGWAHPFVELEECARRAIQKGRRRGS